MGSITQEPKFSMFVFVAFAIVGVLLVTVHASIWMWVAFMIILLMRLLR